MCFCVVKTNEINVYGLKIFERNNKKKHKYNDFRLKQKQKVNVKLKYRLLHCMFTVL